MDKVLEIILDNTLKGDAIKKIKTMVEVVYQVWHDTFSAREGNTVKLTASPSRRQHQVREVWEDLRMLKKRWQKASEEERTALNQIWAEVRQNLIHLSIAEITRKKH